jgi:hypothetical protein
MSASGSAAVATLAIACKKRRVTMSSGACSCRGRGGQQAEQPHGRSSPTGDGDRAAGCGDDVGWRKGSADISEPKGVGAKQRTLLVGCRRRIIARACVRRAKLFLQRVCARDNVRDRRDAKRCRRKKFFICTSSSSSPSSSSGGRGRRRRVPHKTRPRALRKKKEKKSIRNAPVARNAWQRTGTVAKAVVIAVLALAVPASAPLCQSAATAAASAATAAAALWATAGEAGPYERRARNFAPPVGLLR